MPGSFYPTGIVTVTGQTGTIHTALDRILTGVSAVKKWDGASTFVDNTAEARLEGGVAFKLVDSQTEYLLVGFDAKGRAIRIDIATAMVGGGAVTAEYWNGSAWTALTITDGTSAWTVDGEITWAAPSDWATSTVDSLLAYYVRFKCATNPSTDPTANFVVYNWTIYDGSAGTNQKVYKSIGEDGTRNLLLWVSHVAGDVQHARAVLYESWDASLHTGSQLTPTAAQVSGGMFWRVSATADATARAISAYVSRDLAALFLYTGDTASQAFSHGCGILTDTLLAGDVWANLIWGYTVTGTANSILRWTLIDTTLNATTTSVFAQRAYTGAAGAVFTRLMPLLLSSGATSIAYPNLVDGGLIYQRHTVTHDVLAVRGSLPSAWILANHSAGLTDGSDLVVGSDTYRIIQVKQTNYSAGPIWIGLRKD